MPEDEVLTLDEENELYGYGVFNVHANCLVDLPESESKTIGTPNHVVKDPDDNLLHKVAEDHGMDSLSHLRVVEVRLANELDKQASERVTDE